MKKRQNIITIIVLLLGVLLISGGILFSKSKFVEDSTRYSQYMRDVKPSAWTATDGVGRTLTTQNNKASDGKFRNVGVFYWPWHYENNINSPGPYNVNNINNANPSRIHDWSWWNNNYSSGAYWWNQPIYGYYQELDEYVLRKQAELLADAKVDFIVLDCTNSNIVWKDGYEKILKVWKEAQNDGVNVPKIAFMTNFTYSDGGDSAVEQLLTNLYDPSCNNYKNYQDYLYTYNGKFLLLLDVSGLKDTSGGEAKLAELQQRFEVRDPVATYFDGINDSSWKPNGEWGWLSVNPQAVYKKAVDTRAEQVTVSVSQNATYDTNQLTAMNGNNVMGRSFAKGNYFYTYQSKGKTITVDESIKVNGTSSGANTSLYGRNFQQQWDYAIEIDPEIIFVTGWNEWIMGRQEQWPSASDGASVTNAFPDQFNDEYSRDIEPSSGDLKDNYYYQLVENIRRYKGVSSQSAQSTPISIDINKTTDWDNANLINYYHYVGGKERNARGWGLNYETYVNNTFRNDIVNSKVSYDSRYIYFYVETVDDLSGDLNDKFMRLLIDSKDNKTDSNSDNWEGFEYIVNKTYTENNLNTVKLEKFTGSGFATTAVGDVLYTRTGNVFQLAIPRVYLGLTSNNINFRFKWADNNLDNGDIMTLYTDGDVAPGGRFTYSFTGAAASDSVIPVLGISLNKSETTIDVGSKEALSVTFNPTNATNKSITWTSSDTSVATVSSSGVVSGVKAGTATITATSQESGKTATCVVTVNDPFIHVTGVTLNESFVSIEVGKTTVLSPTVSPSNATNKAVTWISTDPSVATVSSSGEVTGIKAGNAAITVRTVDGNKTATCAVQVTDPIVQVTGVSLNNTATSIEVGHTTTLVATVSPNNATDKSVTWESSDTSVATVSDSGVVTGVKAGTATITVRTVDGNKTATCLITVNNQVVHVTGVSLEFTDVSIEVGATWHFTATISPSNATNKNVTWSSSDETVATISGDGIATGLKEGTTWITVTTVDGQKSTNCLLTVRPKTIAVTGVSLNKSTTTIEVGKTETLVATVTPANATNKAVTWTSSDTSIATVSSSGEVTGIKAGTATITVKTTSGNKTAICDVTIKNPVISVTGVSLNKSTTTIEVGKTETLVATVNPSNATNKSVTWSSSDTSIANVSSSGVVTGVKAGTATITVRTVDGNKTATCAVTIKNPVISVTSVSLNKTQATIDVGKTVELTATVTPSNATNKTVTWESSDTSIATVSNSGVVTGVKAGTATITVRTVDGNKTATCNVTVKTPTVQVTGVSLNKSTTSVEVGHNTKLIATVMPNNATNKNVTWTSSDESVATVSNGLVTGVKKGTATITVRTVDGNKTATCMVNVVETSVPVTGVSLNKQTMSLNIGMEEQLIPTVTPSNTTNDNVVWTSSDTSVATVSLAGVVTGIKAGSVTITVRTVDGNKTATCEVTVIDPTIYVTGVNINKTELSIDIGKTETLVATVTPSNATNKSVTWTSSDTSIVSVSDSGIVTGIKAGTATITVKTVDGNKTATCEVTVIKEEDSQEPIDNNDNNKESNNLIKTITINGTSIPLEDDKVKYSYTVDNSIDTVEIGSTLVNDEISFVTGYGPRKVPLKVGKNVVLLKVLTNEKEITYEIEITRLDLEGEIENVPNTGLSSELLTYISIICLIITTFFVVYKKQD